MENKFSQKALEEILEQALLAELNVQAVAKYAAKLLLETAGPKTELLPKQRKRVSRAHVLVRLQKRKLKTPGFYNLETHRVHGDSPRMRSKYPGLVFRRFDGVRVCGSSAIVRSYEKEMEAPILVSDESEESEEDLLACSVSEVKKLILDNA